MSVAVYSALRILRLKTPQVCNQAFVMPTPLGIILVMCQEPLRVLPFRRIVPVTNPHRFDTPERRFLLCSLPNFTSKRLACPFNQPDGVHCVSVSAPRRTITRSGFNLAKVFACVYSATYNAACLFIWPRYWDVKVKHNRPSQY